MNRNNPDHHQKTASVLGMSSWSKVTGLICIAISYRMAVWLGLFVVAQLEGIVSI
jgi:hypothetical protein